MMNKCFLAYSLLSTHLHHPMDMYTCTPIASLHTPTVRVGIPPGVDDFFAIVELLSTHMLYPYAAR